MANEFKHGSVGTELTQAEWEAVGTHVIDSQATGDIVYASSSSQLSRLGKGADNTVLHLASGIPAWSATLAGLTLTTPTISSTGFANANHAHAASNSGGALTYLGTIATGVWQGTDVGVAYGGTGVSTHTQNGVLVGNGSSAIGSIDMSTKGHVLIGDGTGNPQMLGVGTNNHVMTADSGETTGVKWAAPAAAAAGSLTGSTLASGVVTTSVTTVGALNAGSITSGFGTINNGSSTITSTGTVSTGALSPSGTITHTGAAHNHELGGGGGAVSQLISNTGTAADDVAYLELKTAGNAHGTYTAPHTRYTHGGSTHNWYTGVDLTQYEADTFFIGTGTTVGSNAKVSISSQTGRNVPGFRIDPTDFTSSGTTSDVGGYTFASLAHNITWNSDPGDNAGAKWQINILYGGTMVNSSSAQAFTSAMGATTLAITPPSAGSNITFTHASGINIHNVTSAGTTTNLYGIYMDALSGGGTDIGLSTSNDIDLRSSGTIINVGASGNDWGATALAHVSAVDSGVKALYLHNTSDTNDADTRALLDIIVNGGSGDNETGDPLITVRVTGGENWALGVDNSESDRFVIANDNALGSHDCIRITSSKAVSFDDANASYTTFSSDYACDGCGKTAISMFECCGTVAWHDDVLALRELQLSPQGLQHMAKLGIYEIDGPDDPEPGAAFINYQKATKYTWAGMYQNRARMDSQYEELNKRLEAIGA